MLCDLTEGLLTPLCIGRQESLDRNQMADRLGGCSGWETI